MAAITLKEGDFGSDATVTVGEAALYLPDRSRPGLNEVVPLTAIAEIESLSDDRSGQFKQAAKLGARGFLTTGNPLGLAASVFAVTKIKDVNFAVRLRDGRRFVATADAATLADLRAACRSASKPAGEDDEATARADAVIAKYLGPDALPLEPVPEPEPEPEEASASPASASSPVPASPAPTSPVQPQVAGDRPAAVSLVTGPLAPRRVFGRRGLS